jgi:VCBS repeat-containing protein
LSFEDVVLEVSPPGLLGNDIDADGDPLTTYYSSGPTHGTLWLGADGSFSYTPDWNFVGNDAFTYRAYDGLALSNIANTSITVTSINDPPVASNNSYQTAQNSPLPVPAPGLLANDTDAEGGALTAVLVTAPTHGTLVLSADGSFTYTPANAFTGIDSFTYRASDGLATSDIATVTINVAAPLDIHLTSFTSNGTNLAVNYTVSGAVPPSFSIALYQSPDGVTLGQQLQAVPGNTALGPQSTSIVSTFSDIQGDYYLIAKVDSAGVVAESNETNNTAPFAGGSFVAMELGGKRVVHAHGTNAADTITATLANATTLRIAQPSGNKDYTLAAIDEIHVPGHGGDDVLAIDSLLSKPAWLFGGAGNDDLTGGSGNDTIDGGAGDDWVFAGTGNDIVIGADGADFLLGGGGNDHIAGGGGNDEVSGSDGDDTLLGDDGNDTLGGGAGDDDLQGGADDDDLYGGEGNDTLDGGIGTNNEYPDADPPSGGSPPINPPTDLPPYIPPPPLPTPFGPRSLIVVFDWLRLQDADHDSRSATATLTDENGFTLSGFHSLSTQCGTPDASGTVIFPVFSPDTDYTLVVTVSSGLTGGGTFTFNSSQLAWDGSFYTKSYPILSSINGDLPPPEPPACEGGIPDPQNQPPVAEISNGWYQLHYGQTLLLDGSGSTDPETASAALDYRWDNNNDGIFDATGRTASVPWNTFESLGMREDVWYTVTLVVSDGTNVDFLSTDLLLSSIYSLDDYAAIVGAPPSPSSQAPIAPAGGGGGLLQAGAQTGLIDTSTITPIAGPPVHIWAAPGTGNKGPGGPMYLAKTLKGRPVPVWKPTTGEYNCHAFTVGGSVYSVIQPEPLGMILDDAGYKPNPIDASIKPGDIIVWEIAHHFFCRSKSRVRC